jgi:hypothetical protein
VSPPWNYSLWLRYQADCISAPAGWVHPILAAALYLDRKSTRRMSSARCAYLLGDIRINPARGTAVGLLRCSGQDAADTRIDRFDGCDGAGLLIGDSAPRSMASRPGLSSQTRACPKRRLVEMLDQCSTACGLDSLVIRCALYGSLFLRYRRRYQQHLAILRLGLAKPGYLMHPWPVVLRFRGL